MCGYAHSLFIISPSFASAHTATLPRPGTKKTFPASVVHKLLGRNLFMVRVGKIRYVGFFTLVRLGSSQRSSRGAYLSFFVGQIGSFSFIATGANSRSKCSSAASSDSKLAAARSKPRRILAIGWMKKGAPGRNDFLLPEQLAHVPVFSAIALLYGFVS